MLTYGETSGRANQAFNKAIEWQSSFHACRLCLLCWILNEWTDSGLLFLRAWDVFIVDLLAEWETWFITSRKVVNQMIFKNTLNAKGWRQYRDDFYGVDHLKSRRYNWFSQYWPQHISNLGTAMGSLTVELWDVHRRSLWGKDAFTFAQEIHLTSFLCI